MVELEPDFVAGLRVELVVSFEIVEASVTAEVKRRASVAVSASSSCSVHSLVSNVDSRVAVDGPAVDAVERGEVAVTSVVVDGVVAVVDDPTFVGAELVADTDAVSTSCSGKTFASNLGS